MKAIIPLSAEELGGPYVEAESRVLARKEKASIVNFIDLPPEIRWFVEFEKMYAQLQHDGETLKVVRKATQEDIKRFRVPIWIQGEEIPECCGKPMIFVGQIDDDVLCTEAPTNAKYW
jgi:hypothetical protein